MKPFSPSTGSPRYPSPAATKCASAPANTSPPSPASGPRSYFYDSLSQQTALPLATAAEAIRDAAPSASELAATRKV